MRTVAWRLKRAKRVTKIPSFAVELRARGFYDVLTILVSQPTLL